MCGVAAILDLSRAPLAEPERACALMNALQQHRGPDGEGTWVHPEGFVAFGHRRLSVIDAETGQQPMRDRGGNVITYNGQTYNYRELAGRLNGTRLTTRSDTEVVLHAYRRWGVDCVHELRGMFAFALWDQERQTLFCARDRLGIKPLYYSVVDRVLYLASEIKALVPFLPAVETNLDAFNEYLRFQFCLNGRTLFKGVHELRPGHRMIVRNGEVAISRYWTLPETQDLDGANDHEDGIRAGLAESVALHLRSDIPIGAYVSGGLDSSIVASLAADAGQAPGLVGFAGKFSAHPDCDESAFARTLAGDRRFPLHEVDISDGDFVDTIQQVVYHLDFPVAGIGSFPQYVVSRAASRHRRVLLGGQGADELFGGYVRYLIANNQGLGSIEQVLHGVGDYTALVDRHDASIADAAVRYFRLIDRSNGLDAGIRGPALDREAPFDDFQQIFRANGSAMSALDLMKRFDLQTVLPALLHVEDRVSMAHGLESRVPFLDHPLVELAARIPSAIKMKDGVLKHLLRRAMRHTLPDAIAGRTTKMGFPVPFHDWLRAPGAVRDFVMDVLSSEPARTRSLVDNGAIAARLDAEPRFGRGIWGFLCLELWQRAFHDESWRFRRLVTRSEVV